MATAGAARRTTACTVAATALLLLCVRPLFAQQTGVEALSKWYGQSRGRNVYLSAEPELAQIFQSADSLSLPYSILINRLNLGSARRLAPDELVRGMREELSRLKAAAQILTDVGSTSSGRRILSSSTRPELLNAVSIYLSGGLSRDLLVRLIGEGARSGRTADEAFRACAVLLAVDRVGHFPDAQLLTFGAALLGSSIAPSGYSAVGSFVVRSIATGRGGTLVLAKVEQILNQGGGLPQMELELGRRR